MSAPELYGLLLTGGRSRRMQRDKASLDYAGKSQLARAMELLTPLVARCFVSIRSDQLHDPYRAAYDTIADIKPDLGPIGGIHAALHTYPERAWLILACDLPFLDRATLQHLIAHRASERMATAFRSSSDGLPEPLCAIFEPRSRQIIEQALLQGQQCPRSLLSRCDVELLQLPNPRALDNVNTGEEYAAAQAALAAAEAFSYATDAVISADPPGATAFAKMLEFLKGVPPAELAPVADFGVVDDGSDATGDAETNLVQQATATYSADELARFHALHRQHLDRPDIFLLGRADMFVFVGVDQRADALIGKHFGVQTFVVAAVDNVNAQHAVLGLGLNAFGIDVFRNS